MSDQKVVLQFSAEASEFTKVTNQMAEDIKKLDVHAKSFGNSLRQIQAEGNAKLRAISNEMKGVDRSVTDANKSLTAFAAGLIATSTKLGASITAAVGALTALQFAMVKSASYADNIGDLAESFGLSASKMQDFFAALNNAGVPLDKAQRVLGSISKVVAEGSKELEEYGLNLKGLPIDQAIRKLGEFFGSLQDGPVKQNLIASLGREFTALIPVMNAAKGNWASLTEEQRKYVISISDASTKTGSDFVDATERAKRNLQSLFVTFAQDAWSTDFINNLNRAMVAMNDAAPKIKEWGDFVGRMFNPAKGGLLGVWMGVNHTRASEIAATEEKLKSLTEAIQKHQSALANVTVTTRVSWHQRELARLQTEQDAVIQQMAKLLGPMNPSADTPAPTITPVKVPPVVTAGVGAAKRTAEEVDEIANLIERAEERLASLADSMTLANPFVRFAEEWKTTSFLVKNGMIDSATMADHMKSFYDSAQAAFDLKNNPMKDFTAALEAAADPLAEIEARYDKLNQAFAAGRLSIKAYNAEFAVIAAAAKNADPFRAVKDSVVQLSDKIVDLNGTPVNLKGLDIGTVNAVNAEIKRLSDGLKEGAITAVEFAAGMDGVKRMVASGNNSIFGSLPAQIQGIADNFANSTDKLKLLDDTLKKFKADLASGAISPEVFAVVERQIASLKEGITGIRDPVLELRDALEGAFVQGFGALDEMVRRGEFSVKSFAKSMTLSILNAMQQVLISKIAKNFMELLFPSKGGGGLDILKMIAGAFAGSFGGGGGMNAKLSKFADGGAFMSGLGMPYGVYNSPTYFAMPGSGPLRKFAQGGVFGEAGPEAIMPLRRDSSGRLGVESTPMNVVVNNNVGAEVRVRESEEGLTIDLVRKQLINDIRSGGNGFANAFAGTYGLNRINR